MLENAIHDATALMEGISDILKEIERYKNKYPFLKRHLPGIYKSFMGLLEDHDSFDLIKKTYVG